MSAPRETGGDYLPALRFRWLNPCYDALVALTTRESTVKPALLRSAGVRPGHRVLDLGCGTGTLGIALARQCPEAAVMAVDADGTILELARAKAVRAGANVAFQRALAQTLPYARESFERVVSSLFFHHLTRVDKLRALREVDRVLVPGGELYVADWGRPADLASRFAFLAVRLLDGFEPTADNVAGRLPALAQAAGLTGVREIASYRTPLGTMRLWKAKKPRAP